MDLPRIRHLDANAGREVVYCHGCRHEWYKDEGGLRCPRCESEITEIVTPGEDDPRFEGDPLRDLRRFDRTPHPYHHHRHEGDDSDPSEGDIDDLEDMQSGSFLHSTPYGNPGPRRGGERAGSNPRPGPSANPNPNQQPNPNPDQPQNPNAGPNAPRNPDADRAHVLRRFQDMLLNDFRIGSVGRSGRDTLFPDPPLGGSPHVYSRRINFNNDRGGYTAMSFTIGGGGGGSGGGGVPFPANPFDQYGDSPLSPSSSSPSRSPATRSSPIPAITFITFESTDSRPRMVNSMMGIAPPTPSPGATAQNASQRVGTDLASILANLLGVVGSPNGGVHGDAVYTQEAMDRILTQLMEQNQGSNAPPPARQEDMDNLPRRRLDDEMLPGGTGECTICIQDVALGDEVVVLPCNHWFHEECIMHWLREHGTCPICRQAINSSRNQEGGSNAPPSSGAGPSAGSGAGSGPHPGSGSGPGAGAGGLGEGSGGSSQTRHPGAAHLHFFATSASPPPRDGGMGGTGPNPRRSPSAAARQARLDAIRNIAGMPSENSGDHSSPHRSSSTRHYNRTYRSRSRSPQAPSDCSQERRQRSPSSSQSRRSSMFVSSSSLGASDRERRGANNHHHHYQHQRDWDRDRDRRASHFAVSSGTHGSSNGGSSGGGASNGNNGNSSGTGGALGWLRNQFTGGRRG